MHCSYQKRKKSVYHRKSCSLSEPTINQSFEDNKIFCRFSFSFSETYCPLDARPIKLVLGPELFLKYVYFLRVFLGAITFEFFSHHECPINLPEILHDKILDISQI